MLMPLAAKLALCLALAALIGWGITLHRARGAEATAEAAFPPEGQILSVSGVQVHAVVMGKGPDVVLIHGSSGNTRDMTYALAPELAKRYRVIVFDRPGLGYSDPLDPKGASLKDQAKLLSQAAAQLGAENPILVGHSFGGALALAWAVHHPDRVSGIVALAAGSHPWNTGLSTYYKILSHPVLGRLTIPFITAFVGEDRVQREFEGVFAPDAVPDGYLNHFGPGLTLRRASLRANALQRANLLDEITTLAPRYSEIAVPLEILHGTVDTVVGLNIHSRPLAAAVEGANLVPLEGLGHMIQHSAQAETIEAVDRVTARLTQQP